MEGAHGRESVAECGGGDFVGLSEGRHPLYIGKEEEEVALHSCKEGEWCPSRFGQEG